MPRARKPAETLAQSHLVTRHHKRYQCPSLRLGCVRSLVRIQSSRPFLMPLSSCCSSSAFFRLTVARCLSWPCSKDSASCLEFCDLRHCIVGLDASVDSGAIWTWTDFIRRADFRGTRKVHARRRNRRDHDRLQDVSPGPRSDTIPGATCKLARRFVRVGDGDFAAQLLRISL